MMKPFISPWPYLDPADDFARIADQRYSLFFDGHCPTSPHSRYSYICWAPMEMIEAKNGRVTVTNREGQLSYKGDPFEILQNRLDIYAMDTLPNPDLPPFQGGAAGCFGYDLARALEKLPKQAREDDTLPDMMIGIYNQIIAYDHMNEKAWMVIHARTEKERDRRMAMFLSLPEVGTPHFSPYPMQWISERTDSSYEQDIQNVIDYIYEGDIFQANLSRRLEAQLPFDFDPYGHYHILRNTNPTPFSSYMNFGDIQIASCSPERFLKVTDGIVETRPIKGTLPDDKPQKDLLNSEKDRAENAMIVDLLRNDLSKVCTCDSVRVRDFCKVESYEGLHHLVSSVEGKLADDQTSISALKACFPGGSVTGAPKIRAMEIIEELEPQRRGIYCGALGYIGFDGTMDTAITIRTLIYKDGAVQLQTGGGIVADSNSASELDETLTKADALLSSFSPYKRQESA